MNIQVLGVGHSGTTILTRMIQAMGWNLGNADTEHAENVDIRTVNIGAISTKVFDYRKASTLVHALEQPWAIKDPRFVLTQEYWNTVYQSLQSFPLMVYAVRDAKAILDSHRRRNEDVSLQQIIDLQKRAATGFATYSGPKLKIQYEKLVNAIKMFDVNR